MRILKQHPILKPANDYVIDAPQPTNISYWWNVGSLLGLSLVIQIITGVTLAMHYNSSVIDAFNSVEHIMRDVNNGWLIRYLHSNTASAFFFLVYLHIGKGLYYGSYKAPRTLVWTIGTTIFILMIVTAFLGYVLPYGQMSLWGATVITNLMSAIPWIGQDIVEFIWGGFSVNNATLNRFFSLHFLFPFLLAALVLMHLMSLHDSAGSGNPIGTGGAIDRAPFAPYYVFKDLITVFIYMAGLSAFVFFIPNILGDSENYIMANPMQTPAAIVPEWYLLPFYAILRAIPNKLWGVIGMLFAILIILIMALTDITKLRGIQFKPANKTIFFLYGLNLIFLMTLGAKHVESPFIEFAQIGTFIYFIYYLFTVPAGANAENSLSQLYLDTKQKLMSTKQVINDYMARSLVPTHAFASLPLQSTPVSGNNPPQGTSPEDGSKLRISTERKPDGTIVTTMRYADGDNDIFDTNPRQAAQSDANPGSEMYEQFNDVIDHRKTSIRGEPPRGTSIECDSGSVKTAGQTETYDPAQVKLMKEAGNHCTTPDQYKTYFEQVKDYYTEKNPKKGEQISKDTDFVRKELAGQHLSSPVRAEFSGNETDSATQATSSTQPTSSTQTGPSRGNSMQMHTDDNAINTNLDKVETKGQVEGQTELSQIDVYTYFDWNNINWDYIINMLQQMQALIILPYFIAIAIFVLYTVYTISKKIWYSVLHIVYNAKPNYKSHKFIKFNKKSTVMNLGIFNLKTVHKPYAFISVSLQSMPSPSDEPVHGVKCPDCSEKGKNVWIAPGKSCPVCGNGGSKSKRDMKFISNVLVFMSFILLSLCVINDLEMLTTMYKSTIYKLLNLISYDYCDVPRPWGLYFQDSASPQMEALVELHDNIMFYLVIILFAVGWMLYSILFKDKSNVAGKYVSHGSLIELLWTVLPGLILVFVAFTSFKLLYLMDEVSDVNMTLYIEGHQWYWSYQYPDFMTDDGEFIEYDSYLIPESDLESGALRMLDVDERVIIPEVTHARFLVSSGDVIHSYACPSLGIKADAYPGRLNQASTLINRLGTFYGQCSEICGILHSSMPITIQSVTLEKFLVFLEEK